MNQPDAKKELQKFCDPEYSGYLGDVTSNAEGIQRAIDGWAEVLEKMCTPINPAVTPLVLAGAKAAFKTAAEGMYLDGAVFQAAVNTFTQELAVGMADPSLHPPLGYSATPPPGIYIPTAASQNHETACDQMAAGLLAFLQTGTAVDNFTGPPAINWS